MKSALAVVEPESRSKSLDVALIDALRRGRDVVGHSSGIELAEWTRQHADRIERERAAIHRSKAGRSAAPNGPSLCRVSARRRKEPNLRESRSSNEELDRS
jgi:hypothetical protein